jgi:hypothetical protein
VPGTCQLPRLARNPEKVGLFATAQARFVEIELREAWFRGGTCLAMGPGQKTLLIAAELPIYPLGAAAPCRSTHVDLRLV